MAAAVRGKRREQKGEDQERGTLEERRFRISLEEGEKKEKDGVRLKQKDVESERKDSLESLFLQKRRQKRKALMIPVASAPVQTEMSEFWRIPPHLCASTHSSTCACWNGAELRTQP